MTDHNNQGLQPNDTPDVLYKYMPFNKYSIGLLKYSEIWLASARSFNDPFDSRLHYNTEVKNPALRVSWAEDFINKTSPGLSASQARAKAKDFLDDVDKDPAASSKRFNEAQERNIENSYGLLCLTPKPDNLLMWAHYASNHKGFCVGFDMREILKFQYLMMKRKELLELRKIEYSSMYPKINFFESMMSPDYQQDIITLLVTKSEEWEYEEEYRLLYWDKSNVAMNLPIGAIKEIVLGSEMKSRNRQVVINIARRVHNGIELFDAKKSDSRFSLNLNPL